MKTRQKDPEIIISDTSNFKQKIKASQSEIMKDFMQISNSLPVFKRVAQIDSDICKLQKVSNNKRPRKMKTKITEDISPILGLATFINEMNSCEMPFMQEKFPKQGMVVGNIIGGKNVKNSKPKVIIKLAGFTRAETHIGIAQFISKGNKNN
ncbi:hypothetical protein SteCoe_31145 [Stentor coeruleus]|uniref:Uncharacterized protein n=1 Tax=Stentor coeruleus TaxID=5963 RepID=A0A1R2B222_9CILI|nr:hypothetical protein SteCoe_31145 [Stentor coeruleus]